MSVELNAYLFFPGNAEQAIAFYQQVFGGEVTITRVGDVDPTAAPEQKNLVINAQLIGGDITLRASDRQDTSTDPQTRIELSLIGTDDARLRALFDGLAEAAPSGPSWRSSSGATSSAPSPTSTASAGRSTSAPPAPDVPAHSECRAPTLGVRSSPPGRLGHRASRALRLRTNTSLIDRWLNQSAIGSS